MCTVGMWSTIGQTCVLEEGVDAQPSEEEALGRPAPAISLVLVPALKRSIGSQRRRVR